MLVDDTYLRVMRKPLLHAPLLPSSILPLPRDTYRVRKPTYPLANSSRQKPRRWPLVLRFGKGSIHKAIVTPLIIHAIITALVVWASKKHLGLIDLPNSIMPGVSIVVALMLVFRNQTAYSRFWNSRLHLNTVTSSIRCLTRTILVNSPPRVATRRGSDTEVRPGLRRTATRSLPDMMGMQEDEEAEEKKEGVRRTEEIINILIAMMYTTSNHLRNDWGVALSPGPNLTQNGQELSSTNYSNLIPSGFQGFEHRGLALTLELSIFIESFFSYGTTAGWFNTGHLSQMVGELNSLIKAYGDMEVIRLMPIPVAHLIHHQQTLAIYCVFLAVAMAGEMGWWAVPIVSFVAFTLYGIEGIAKALEDPFGRTNIDLKMDDIFEDTRREVEVLLEVWQTQNHNRSAAGNDKCRMFVPHMKRENSVRSASPAASVVQGSAAGKHVKWDTSEDTSEDMVTSTETSGTMSPLTKAQVDTFGARRVTWGSAVGAGDKGVYSTPVFFEGVGV